MYPGTGAEFKYAYCCPFLDTCGIHPQNLQITCFATRSNNKPGQEEDQRAPPFAEEVYRREHNDIALVSEGVPHLMCSHDQEWDTPPVS